MKLMLTLLQALEEMALTSSTWRPLCCQGSPVQGEVVCHATFPEAVETTQATIKSIMVSIPNGMKECHSYPLYRFMHEELCRGPVPRVP
jgi:hypothetical protein